MATSPISQLKELGVNNGKCSDTGDSVTILLGHCGDYEIQKFYR